jgi:N-methylhydantoinase A
MRLAIDTGGTFTDCVFVRGGRLHILKVLSTPHNPAEAIGHALSKVFVGAQPVYPESARAHERAAPELDLTCGTTVGTNALLQRRGGRVALVTTAGFEDVLAIGRQARPRLYDFFVTRPEPLAPASRRFGLRERIAYDGRVLARPSPAELRRVARLVARSRPDAVAVCLLFSFTNPSHEKQIARGLRRHGFQVSVSHEILPEFREYERTATTVINAYLLPVMSGYLGDIERRANAAVRRGRAQVRIMQSSGGVVSTRIAAREPVRTILSGPAGGILGAKYVAELAGYPRIVSFDMGGTSTDVALVEGSLRTTNESTVADLPVAVPMLDIHTVGAGGGSLARFDRAGALRVGPESAGADPGPICYGRGTQPTVTDAHLILGHLAGGGLLGGEFALDARRTREWMHRARGTMGSAEEFAQGVVEVANATMEKAMRVISVERGYDPRDYTLVAFGGAGGLHACDLAAALRMPRVLVPRFPGGLSALGILRADVVKEFSQTVRLAVKSPRAARAALRSAFAALERVGQRELRAEGFAPRQIRVERLLDMRYAGQAYELTVPAPGDFVAAFHRAHEQRYGYSDAARDVEVVNVRARFIGATHKPAHPRSRPAGADARAAMTGITSAIFAGRSCKTAVYTREKLRASNRMRGPAVICEYSATTLVPPGWHARVDEYENLLLER